MSDYIKKRLINLAMCYHKTIPETYFRAMKEIQLLAFLHPDDREDYQKIIKR